MFMTMATDDNALAFHVYLTVPEMYILLAQALFLWYIPHESNIGHRRTVRRSVGDRKAKALQAACWIRCRVSSEQLADKPFAAEPFY